MKFKHQITDDRSTSTFIETINQVSNALLYIKEEDDIYNIIEEAIKKLLPNVYFLVSKLQSDDFNFRVIKHFGFDNYLNAITKIVGKDPTSFDFPLTNLSEEQQTSMKSRKLHHFSDGVYSFVNGLVNRTICKTLEKLLGISEVCAMSFCVEKEYYGGIIFFLPSTAIKNNLLSKEIESAIEIISNHSSTVIQKLRDQSALKASEKRVELAVESAGIGMWEFYFQNKTAWRSLRHDQIFGYQTLQAAWDKQIYLSHVHEEERELVNQKFEEVFITSYLQFECRIIGSDGVLKWISVYGHLQHDEKDIPTRLVGTVMDITERKTDDENLREKEAFFRAQIENSYDVIFSLDADGKFVFISPSWERNFGYPVEETLGKNFIPYIHPDDVTPLYNYLKRVLNSGKNESSPHYRVKTVDGRLLWYIANGSYSVNGKGERYFMGVGHDITENILAEEELKKSQEQLKKFATYLQNKQEEDNILLAAKLDNELGQNLVALKMDIGLIKKKVLKENIEESEEIINKLDQTYISIGKTVSTTLKFMDSLQYEVLYLMGIVEAIKFYSNEFEEINHIKCELLTILTNLNLDKNYETSLFRIFQNAMSNVAEHSKATEVKINLYLLENKLLLEILDNGIGFDQERVKSNSSTGLVFMKERANLMGGELFINSNLNQGTSIRVEIPFSE